MNVGNPFKKFRIDYMIFASISVFVIVLLAIVASVSYTASSAESVKQTSDYQRELLIEMNKQLIMQKSTIEQISLGIALNSELQEYLVMEEEGYAKFRKQSDVDSLLSNIAYSLTSIEFIDVYMTEPIHNSDNKTVRFFSTEELHNQPWYDAVKNTDSTWVQEHTIATRQGNKDVISFARNVYSNHSKYIGLLVIHVNVNAFKSTITGSGNGNRIILDAGGKKMTGIGSVVKDDIDSIDMKSLHDSSGHLRLKEKGLLLVWSRLFDTNWVLVQLTPWAEVVQGSEKLAGLLLSLGAGAVLCALLVAWFVSLQINRPMRELMRAMAQFNIGNRGNKKTFDYYNEFGYLFRGYVKLTERIESLYRALEQRYRRQKEAEIQALQAMINPHFLYNTLDQINWMAIKAKQDEISKVLEWTGRMFRIGLSNGESLITIREEMEYVRCYMQIQHIRLRGRVAFQVDSSEELMDLYVPKLTLQPFVENAVMHGFPGLQTGTVYLKVECEERFVRMTVSDTGIGLAEGWDRKEDRRTGGYGIRNVRERLEAYFGGEYQLTLAAKEDGGTEVIIRFPQIQTKNGVIVHEKYRDH
ncbi:MULTISPECIES: sensor histidine kinase [unclassified Paenibacillus]|uniref:sensor histidine kinase n=1 Tax=unclassified Paenibacillus TaxID=185978 RepID=UPI001C103E0B|nr:MULTISPECIES: sensor histidine kinase [unclassified Paenibacillus]MBU5444953.1 sensor histidine kinase [Paenibacillus sp. MSJ-34]CAH0120199.1 hypothetical protein PAE9249_02713 [Paenibacillus sp. CECT 9249]